MRNNVLTELYVGGSLGWIDASADARQGSADSGGAHTITRTEGDPGRCDFVLSSPDGRWSPRNPRSPYRGLLGRNTPVRVGLELFRDTFDGPTLADSWGPGWHNVWAGGTFNPSQFVRDAGSVFHRQPTAAGYRLSYYEGRKFADCEVRTSFTVAASDVVGGSLEPANLVMRLQDIGTYYMARVEITTTEAVQVSIHHSTAGTIAAAVALAGVVYAGQQWEVAASCTGDRLAVKAWPTGTPEPRDWQLSATDSRIAAPGYVGVRSGVGAGNTNAAPVEFRYYDWRVIDRRASMEVASWPPQWNVRGTDAWVPVTANGITRRLGQGVKPLDSALTRRIPSTSPVAWWTLEDGTDSTVATSGIVGARPLLVDRGLMDFVDDGPIGAAGAAKPNPAADNQLSSPLAGMSAAAWQVGIWTQGARTDANVDTAYYLPAEVRTSGGKIIRLIRQSGSLSWAAALYDTEAQTTETAAVTWSDPAQNFADVLTSGWHLLQVGFTQNGSTVDVALWVDGVQRATATWATTLGAPVSIRAIGRFGGPGGAVSQNMTDIWLSHLTLHNGAAIVPLYTAGLGYQGELAADRFARLCAEQGLPALITRGPDPSEAMGPQRPETLLKLLRDCADVDGGIMGEAREQLALTYVCRGALYNRAAVQLTYPHLAPPLAPADDDRDVRNDVTVKRAGGASARAVLQAGPLSVQPPPAGVGVYDTAPTLNVATDAQLPDLAGWRLHVGTWDEARYPTVRVNLASPVWASDVQLADTVTALEAGQVLQLSALPVWLPPGPVLLQVRGAVEQIDQYTRSIDFALQPAGPYTVATVDGEPRVAADGSTLAAAITSTALTLQIKSTSQNGPWTTAAADFPLDVRVGGGERVTLSGISGTGLTQTATVSARGVNGVQLAWPAGTTVDVWVPAVAPL